MKLQLTVINPTRLHYMDLTAQGVDKGSALKTYAVWASTPFATIAAIGDQPIDLPMFTLAGLSVAMGNAPETVKSSVHWVAPSNDQEGVAWAINKILGVNARQL